MWVVSQINFSKCFIRESKVESIVQRCPSINPATPQAARRAGGTGRRDGRAGWGQAVGRADGTGRRYRSEGFYDSIFLSMFLGSGRFGF